MLVGNIGSVTVSPESFGGGWLNFGMNEHPDPYIPIVPNPGKYGKGVFRVTIIWLNDLLD